MSADQYITIAILALTFVLLIKSNIPPVAVFVGSLTLTITFRLAPLDQSLKGFSNSGMLTVGALLMVAAGMYRTGAITLITVGGRATARYWLFNFNVPEKGVFEVYILVFSLEKGLIGSGALTQLIPITVFYDFAPFGPKAQTFLHWLNKGLAPHSDIARPFAWKFEKEFSLMASMGYLPR